MPVFYFHLRYCFADAEKELFTIFICEFCHFFSKGFEINIFWEGYRSWIKEMGILLEFQETNKKLSNRKFDDNFI